MAAVAIPGLPPCHHQPKGSPPPEAAAASAASSHGTAHLGSHLQSIFLRSASQAKPRRQQLLQFFPSPNSPMAGGSPPTALVLTDAGSPEADVEAPWRQRSTSEQYAELAALLPGLPRRATQVDILDAAVAHLKVLQDTAAVLEAYRALQSEEEPAHSRAAVEVVSREAVCFEAGLPAAARPGALTRVLEAFDRRGVEVLAATVMRHGDVAQVTVTAAPAAPEVTESIKAEIAGIE